MANIVLSHFQADQLLAASQAGQPVVACSPDLGITTANLSLTPGGVAFPDGSVLDWECVEEIHANPNGCYVFEGGSITKVQAFSPVTDRFCSLMPTASAPTLLIAGFPMHRIKDTDPYRDTLSKLQAIQPVHGRVLDTATGLGYTAIQASQDAEQVVTIELDPAVLEIARLNPWSQALFDTPKITQIVGDSFEEVKSFEDGYFARILHDPPTLSLAGDLYSTEFYRELYRILSRGGRLFHYTGSLESDHGKKVSRGVIQRLYEAGFKNIRPYQRAFGIIARKG